MTSSRRILALGCAAPLALALAACNDTEASDDVLSGEPIAAIPAPEGTSWTDTVVVTEEGGYQVGNPEAPLKLVEFASHTCGACASFAATGVVPLKEKYVTSGVVSFEIRNLVRDPVDLTIATLVRCGQKENMMPLADQAWASLSAIMGNVQGNNAAYQAAGQMPVDQRFIGIAEAAGLIDFFSARGLSADQARTCLADGARIQAIADTSAAQSEELNVNATPTFFLNDARVEALSWDQLEPALQRAGAR